MGQSSRGTLSRTIALAAALSACAAPAEAAGTSGADFLNIPVGGRPAALGGAYTAAAADAYAPVWNPGGLGRLPGTQLAGMHLEQVESIRYEFVSFVHPFGEGDGLGAAVQYYHPPSVTARDTTGADVGSFTSHYAAYSLGYGRALGPALSLGATLKVIDAAIGDVSGHAYGCDLGALYRFSPRFALGASARNIGTDLKLLQTGDSLPDTYHLSALFAATERLNLFVEGAYNRQDESPFARFGAEWRPVPAAALRVGYHTDSTSDLPGVTGLTTGIGFDIFGQRFDYAWVPMGDLGQTQYFSVLFAFGRR